MANALVQVDLMPTSHRRPARKIAGSPAASRRTSSISLILRSGIHDKQFIAMRKTNPGRAAHLVDLLGDAKDLRRIEVALREMAVQVSFLAI